MQRASFSFAFIYQLCAVRKLDAASGKMVSAGVKTQMAQIRRAHKTAPTVSTAVLPAKAKATMRNHVSRALYRVLFFLMQCMHCR